MSQQEFFPESQEQQSQNARQSPWSAEHTRYRRPAQSGDEPKSEHPSTFEESIPPYSYRAQDQPLFGSAYEAPSRQEQQGQQGQQEEYRTAAGIPYRSYQSRQQQQWQAPWWARPQPNAMQGIPKWLIILGILLLLGPLIPFILSLIGVLLTGVLIIILIPFILIGILLLVGVVWLVLMLAGIVPRRWWRW